MVWSFFIIGVNLGKFVFMQSKESNGIQCSYKLLRVRTAAKLTGVAENL